MKKARRQNIGAMNATQDHFKNKKSLEGHIAKMHKTKKPDSIKELEPK
jgi:hypothetical protein